MDRYQLVNQAGDFRSEGEKIRNTDVFESAFKPKLMQIN